MTPVTRFSVVVACYNSEDFIGDCLLSVINQNYPAEGYEIIVVNDGSTDSSAEIIRSFQARCPAVKLFYQENQGLEKACNRGIREASFDHIVRLDADDMFCQNFFERMDDAIQNEPDHDFYYCREYLEYYSEEKQSPKSLPEFNPEEIFSRGDFFATGTVYRKRDLLEIGGFPEKLKNCGLENYSVILRLLTSQKKGFAVPKAMFKYRRHSTNMSTVKRNAIVDFGKQLLKSYGREFTTNRYHPYGLKL